MMTVNDQTGELVDLAEEKVYAIDFKGKSYKVKTFAEMRKEMGRSPGEDEGAGGQEAKEEQPSRPATRSTRVDFSIEKTGQRKTINGYDCQQVVMTITVRQKGKTLEDGGGMVMTTDMWMAPKIPAMQEQIDFTQRYVKKLLRTDAETMARDLAQAMAMYPQMKDAMERMKKEGAKLDGTAVLTTMKVETVMSPNRRRRRPRAATSRRWACRCQAVSAGCSARRRRRKKPRRKASPPPLRARRTGRRS